MFKLIRERNFQEGICYVSLEGQVCDRRTDWRMKMRPEKPKTPKMAS
jgi:hypothetical protein